MADATPPFHIGFDPDAVSNIVRQTGRKLLLPAFQQHHYGASERKQDGSIVTELDHQSQQQICDQLAQQAPSFAFLGEEMEVQQQQHCLDQQATPCWCLDPLDGTSNFMAGMPCFTISLGLIYQGEAIAGWIYDPVADEIFTALPGDPQLRCNGKPITPQPAPPLHNAVGFIDFKRLNQTTAIQFVTNPPCRSYRNLGSCALEWAWLASGRSQFIIHGGESVWDFAAGLALAAKSNCTVSDFHGKSPLQHGKLRASIVAAANPSLHQGLHQALQPSC